MDVFARHAIGMHVADRTLRLTKPELVALIRGAEDRGDGADAAMLKALDCAQETFEGWGKLLSVARTRYVVAASAECVEREARKARA